MLEKLDFYRVDKEYADFLREHDSKVPFIETAHYRYNKFFVGVVLRINNIDYFAPVTSYKGIDKGSFPIIKDGKIISSVRPNFMFPVIEGVYEPININKEFSGSYHRFVMYEFDYCNRYREQIFALARKTYNLRTKPRDKRERDFFQDKIIDFKKLEKVAKKFKR